MRAANWWLRFRATKLNWSVTPTTHISTSLEPTTSHFGSEKTEQQTDRIRAGRKAELPPDHQHKSRLDFCLSAFPAKRKSSSIPKSRPLDLEKKKQKKPKRTPSRYPKDQPYAGATPFARSRYFLRLDSPRRTKKEKSSFAFETDHATISKLPMSDPLIGQMSFPFQ